MANLPATLPETLPPPEIAALTTDQLRAALSRSLAKTAAELTRLAWIVRVLEERGEDLSDLGIGLLDYLRLIAYGRLLPELVVRYSEQPGLLRTVAALPPPAQKSIAAGENVRLVVRGDGGTWTHRLADPSRLTARQARQVFARGRIRDEAEQILYLEDQAQKSGRPAAVRFGHVTADPRRGTVRVGRVAVAVPDLTAALAALRTPEPPAEADESQPGTAVFPVQLTRSEHTSLKLTAARQQTSMQALVHRALAASGLFTQR